MNSMEAPEHDRKKPSALFAIVRLVALALGQAVALWLVTQLFPSIPCNALIDGKNCQPQPTLEQTLVSALIALIFVPFAWWTASQLWRGLVKSRVVVRWVVGVTGYVLACWVTWTALRMILALIGRFTNG